LFSLHDQNLQREKTIGHFQGRFNRLSRNETLFETRLFICELQMLVDAQYVLCAMSSNVCRLVQILRYQHPSTAISLDRPWYGTSLFSFFFFLSEKQMTIKKIQSELTKFIYVH
jgi:hypothetical protein